MWNLLTTLFLIFICSVNSSSDQLRRRPLLLRKKSSPFSLRNTTPSCVKSNKEPFLSQRQGGGDKRGKCILSLLSIRGGATSKTVPALQSNGRKSRSFFPIARDELPQFFSLSSMMFLFIYVFTTVRDTKDTLVVSNCGAEAIPFLKLYGVMPCAFLFIMGYTRMSQLVGKEILFYMTLIPFFIFYAVFAFVLFPKRDIIHSVKDVHVTSTVGKALSSLTQFWSFSLYYIVSELWASAGVPLLFWQVANDVTPLHQAKVLYPLFAVIGNLAPIVSGRVMTYIVSKQGSSDDVGFQSTIQRLATVKIAAGLGIVMLYRLVYKIRDTKERKNVSSPRIEKSPPKKEKLTLSESIKELFKSRELKAMATMVFCYNMCVELTEVLWKGILKKSYPNKTEYMAFMATFSQTVGIIALILQLTASTIITKFGWLWAASLTPIAMVCLAIPFFISVLLSKSKSDSVTLVTALSIGTWQTIISKVTKYSLFDPCKEMAYIPLGPDAKTKGKAAVDVLGARMGRSMGSATQQVLVSYIGSGSILSCAPMLGVVYVITVFYWLSSVRILGSSFTHHFQKDSRNKSD